MVWCTYNMYNVLCLWFDPTFHVSISVMPCHRKWSKSGMRIPQSFKSTCEVIRTNLVVFNM